jgi:hypothetical protein
MVHATGIGWRAHAALTASAGIARVTAPLSRSFYAEAVGEMVWIGGDDAPLHARAVRTPDARVPVAGAFVHVAFDRVTPWCPVMRLHRRDTLRASAYALRAELTTLGAPRGLARLLIADVHDDPMVVRAAPHVRALANACLHDDAGAVSDTARPLLGLGDGLTPSGDDYVGGVLFARALYGRMDQAWDIAISRILSDAAALTHPISARLLTDLAIGEGWAPLHDLANALGAGDTHAAYRGARELTMLGNTSGWNLLGGVIAGLTANVPEPVSSSSGGALRRKP